MRLLVTGATGFLGKHVVACARERGHDVLALVRPSRSSLPSDWGADVDIIRGDLRAGVIDASRLAGIDAVIHLAAAKSGDLHAQLAGTLAATENLVRALRPAGIRRVVLTSTFSVYDYRRVRVFSTLDESSPLESQPFTRDAYCATKLAQERYLRGLSERGELDLTVLRPGVIFGAGGLWTARLGVQASDRTWIRTGAWARLPLSYVENCAEAVLMATESPEAVGATLNVVDDEMPTQRRYCRIVRDAVQPNARIVPIAWSLMNAIAFTIGCVNRVVFRGRAKIPQILNSPSLAARCKPLRYSNRELKRTLGWSPRYGLLEAVARSNRCADDSE